MPTLPPATRAQDGDAGVDPLYILEGLQGVPVEGRSGHVRVGGEEARDRAFQPVAVKEAAGELPLRQEGHDHRVAKQWLA